jgi:outer membrane protein assembly factor BamB
LVYCYPLKDEKKEYRMQRQSRVRLLLGLVFLVIICAAIALAPQWMTRLGSFGPHAIATTVQHPTTTHPASNGGSSPMFGVDPQHTHFYPAEHVLSPSNVSRLAIDWTAATGNLIFPSPAVANGVVYVGSEDEKLYAFNAGGCGGHPTCAPLWTATTFGAIVSSPAVANAVVYVGSGNGKLYAFHLSSTEI